MQMRETRALQKERMEKERKNGDKQAFHCLPNITVNFKKPKVNNQNALCCFSYFFSILH